MLSIWTGAGDKVESASSFSVKTEILGERLGNAELKTFGDKVADSPSIMLEVAGCKTLVCAVEEGEMLLCSYCLCDFLPLILGRIYTGRIVGTSMQKNDAAFWSLLNRRTHAIKVETFCFR